MPDTATGAAEADQRVLPDIRTGSAVACTAVGEDRRVLTLGPGGAVTGGFCRDQFTWVVHNGVLGFRDRDGLTMSYDRLPPQTRVYSLIGAFLPTPPAPLPAPTRASVLAELRTALYGDDSPLAHVNPDLADTGYPHTNLQADLVHSILDVFQPRFWLEFGSMLGGSAIVAANVIKTCKTGTQIVCVDPFTGDVNMWDWEQPFRQAGKWRFLRLEKGRPTIYDRFLANVTAAGHADVILPIPATSIVGGRLLRRLAAQNRLTFRPEVIYLDSAHEADETLLELRMCWDLLRPGGVLVGDDWSWQAIRTDVLRFAGTISMNAESRRRLAQRHGRSLEQNGVLLLDHGQWALVK